MEEHRLLGESPEVQVSAPPLLSNARENQAGAGRPGSWSSTLVTVPSKVPYGNGGKLFP